MLRDETSLAAASGSQDGSIARGTDSGLREKDRRRGKKGKIPTF